MTRPSDLPPSERFSHGTRSRYVCGCRCDLCKKSNRDRYQSRMKRLREAEAGCLPNEEPKWKKFKRVSEKTGTTEFVGRACPGTGGRPCVKGGAWLRGRKVCLPCVERATVWDGLVDATPARKHLRALSRRGVGYKTVADAAGVGHTMLFEVITRTRRRIRAQHEKKILAVDEGARADASLVPSQRSRKLLNKMLAMGYTRAWLSKQLGAKGYAGVFQGKERGQITAKMELKIEKLYRKIESGELEQARPHVDARQTYRILHELMLDFTQGSLEKLLKYKIQEEPPDKVTRRVADRVLRLYENRQPDEIEQLVKRRSR